VQYDYPNDIAESVSDLSTQAASAWASFANKNLKVCPPFSGQIHLSIKAV
jgi:hypothetical protein